MMAQVYGLLLLVHDESAYLALFIVFPVARQARPAPVRAHGISLRRRLCRDAQAS